MIVSSICHFKGRIYWRDLHFEKKNHKYDRINAYTQSKLANIMHARELASRLQETGITVVSLHPGGFLYVVYIKKGGSLPKYDLYIMTIYYL